MKKEIEMGLQLTPAKESQTAIHEAIAASEFYTEFYTEFDSEFACYFFPEERENYDALEAALDNLFAGLNVSYRIEGVF